MDQRSITQSLLTGALSQLLFPVPDVSVGGLGASRARVLVAVPPAERIPGSEALLSRVELFAPVHRQPDDSLVSPDVE